MSDVCELCGRSLISSYKQLRSNDEPATLVVGCPVHGPSGNLLQKYLGKGIEFLISIPTIKYKGVESGEQHKEQEPIEVTVYNDTWFELTVELSSGDKFQCTNTVYTYRDVTV
jgi:hypothetical protein